jgi:hypothetical protein
VSTAMLGTLLWEEAVQAMPAAFMHTLVATVARRAAGAAVPSSLIAQLLIVMAKSKIRTAIIGGVGLLVGLVAIRDFMNRTGDGASQTNRASGSRADTATHRDPSNDQKSRLGNFFGAVTEPITLKQRMRHPPHSPVCAMSSSQQESLRRNSAEGGEGGVHEIKRLGTQPRQASIFLWRRC